MRELPEYIESYWRVWTYTACQSCVGALTGRRHG